jgi:pSer/pThr/pTyr-binding forkhead associated (FHA) protein
MSPHPRLKLLPDGPFIEIDGESLYLGRDCHLALSIPQLKNKLVSSRHCCFKRQADGRWTLEDLGSTNGTWLAGSRLKKGAVLKTGDIVSFGRAGPRFEVSLPVLDPNATISEDEMAAGETLLATPDGSAEHPFKVGKTPEIVLRHDRTGDLFSSKGYTIVLGRAPECQIVIRTDDQKQVSGRHLEIQFRSNGAAVVRDLASKNGSWLNDKPLKGESPLNLGDKLVLGSKITTLVVTRLERF